MIELALLWLEREGFDAYTEDDRIYLIVRGVDMEISQDEIKYLAELGKKYSCGHEHPELGI